MRQRIAIIGGGVSSLVTAHLLHRAHDITLFEADERIGGHVHTVDVEAPDGSRHAVDMGFTVCNEQAYPLFSALLRDLGVGSRPSDMRSARRGQRPRPDAARGRSF